MASSSSAAEPTPDLLPLLLDLLPSGVVRCTPVFDQHRRILDFELTALNPAARQLLGLPAAAAVAGRQLWAPTPPDAYLAPLLAAYHAPAASAFGWPAVPPAPGPGFAATAQRLGTDLLLTLQPAAPDPATQLAGRTQERDDARAEARQQRERLERLFGQAPALVNTQLGPDHVFDLVHPLTYQLLGHRPLVGLSSRQALPELEGPFHELLDQVYTSGQPFFGREVHARLDRLNNGQLDDAYFDFTYQPLLGPDGRVEGIMTFAVEVTEQVHNRRRIEQLNQELEARVAARTEQAQLARAEADAQRHRLEALITQAPVLIASLTGPQHLVELASADFQALFNHRDLLGKPYAEAVPEQQNQGFVALLDEVYRTGNTHHGHEVPTLIERPGEPDLLQYFNFIFQATRAADGQVEGVFIVASDVTDQVQARRQLERQSSELKRLFEQAPAAIAILRGPELIVELANAEVGIIWGRRPADVLGRPYFEAMPETAGQGFEEILSGVLTTGQPFFVTEAPVRLARLENGSPVQSYVNFGFHPLRDAQGRVYSVMALGVEVTEQVRARQQVQALNEALAAANQELQLSNERLRYVNADLDTFVYTASHDLKAPITNIEGLLQVVREEVADGGWTPMADHVMALMQEAVERFRTTLGHLTEVVRLQKNELLPDEPDGPAGVALAAIVEDVRLDLSPLLTATHTRLTIDVAACPVLRLPAKMLRSVAYNLLSNAVKYRAPDRTPDVHFRCWCREDDVLLQVTDNGMGINETQQTGIFNMFRRYHTHVEGSGVGLYMVKRMVEHAGGAIEVASQPGTGSTFTVRFPRAVAPPPCAE